MEIYTSEMRALILAAGLGTRLAPITDKIPKSLVKVNGEPIILKQIENLHRNGIFNITIVSGYKSDILENILHEKYPHIRMIQNIDYAQTNNMYSAYLARNELQGHEFLMMNADVFYDASVITALMSCGFPDAIVTDIGNYYEESMKVVEQDGRLLEISKTISRERAFGTSIDVYKFSDKGSEAFFKKCQEYIEEKEENQLWSEIALNDILGEIEFKACPVKGRWLEIDNQEDLDAAEKLFAEKV